MMRQQIYPSHRPQPPRTKSFYLCKPSREESFRSRCSLNLPQASLWSSAGTLGLEGKVTFSSVVNPLPHLLPSHKLEWQHREEHLRFCCCCSSLYNSPLLLQSEQTYVIWNLVVLAWETFQQTTLFHPGWH